MDLGSAMTSPQPWSRSTRKWRIWTIGCARFRLAPTSRQRASLSCQLASISSCASDERIIESLHQRQWMEAQIYTLMSPTRPSFIVGGEGGNHHHRKHHLPAKCMPHLAPELMSTPQPQTMGHLTSTIVANSFGDAKAVHLKGASLTPN